MELNKQYIAVRRQRPPPVLTDIIRCNTSIIDLDHHPINMNRHIVPYMRGQGDRAHMCTYSMLKHV